MKTTSQSRREFFRTCGRYAVLAMLGAFAGCAMTGRKKPKGEETCLNRGVCRGCPLLRTCQLPPALSAREAMADK